MWQFDIYDGKMSRIDISDGKMLICVILSSYEDMPDTLTPLIETNEPSFSLTLRFAIDDTVQGRRFCSHSKRRVDLPLVPQTAN